MKTLRFVALATVATFCLPAQESGKPKSGVPAEAAAKGAPAAPLIGVVDLVKAISKAEKKPNDPKAPMDPVSIRSITVERRP